MAIGIYISPESMTAAQYDEVIQRLEKAGAASPKGRTYHSAFGSPDHLMVFDVWDSQADFEAFGAILNLILDEVGIKLTEPEVMPIHNTIAV